MVFRIGFYLLLSAGLASALLLPGDRPEGESQELFGDVRFLSFDQDGSHRVVAVIDGAESPGEGSDGRIDLVVTLQMLDAATTQPPSHLSDAHITLQDGKARFTGRGAEGRLELVWKVAPVTEIASAHSVPGTISGFGLAVRRISPETSDDHVVEAIESCLSVDPCIDFPNICDAGGRWATSCSISCLIDGYCSVSCGEPANACCVATMCSCTCCMAETEQ